MKVTGSCLSAAVAASVIAIGSSIAPPPEVRVPAWAPADSRTVSAQTVELLAAAQRMTPMAATALDLAGPSAAVTPGPVPLNAASDFIVNAWNAVLPWIDYGVNLTDYVLGFIPYGYLIGDQISIVYYSLIRPVANSFVVDLVAPVVNEPLNAASYVNGLVALGTVTVNSLINLGISEFNYFFGWLIPPIPPLPLTAPAVETETAELLTAAAVDESGATALTDAAEDIAVDQDVAADEMTDPTATEAHPIIEASEGGEEAVATGAEESEDETTESTRTTDSSGTVEAQGEVRNIESLTADEDADEQGADTSPNEETSDEATDAPEPSTNDDAAGTDTDTDAADSAEGDAAE